MIKIIFVILIFGFIFAQEKVTIHTIQLQEALTYTATVASGKVSYISYIKEGEANRPITFAFNGGPGSSSSFLHLSVLGPRRLLGPEEGGSSTPPYELVDNLETILDLTDLVFIDPSGTGFSEIDEEAHSIKGDIEAIGIFIRDYLTKNGRWNSRKYILGESYGALRAAGIANYLLQGHGIYLNGLIFVSAAIDYQVFFFDTDNPLPYFLSLPSYAATAWYHGKAHTGLALEEVVKNARQFMYETYAPALICPKCNDKESLYSQLAEVTGLPIALIAHNRGKIDYGEFSYNLLLDERKMVGLYDARKSGYYGSTYNISTDPSLSHVGGALSASLNDYLQRELEFKESYSVFCERANLEWSYNYNEWGYPNLMGALRQTLIGNPSMKIFVGCGYFDLVTPFATAEYCMDHLEVPSTSVQMEYYEGGHMFYLNPKARIKFKQDLTHFYR